MHELFEYVVHNYFSDWKHIHNQWLDTGTVFRQYEYECDSSYWCKLSSVLSILDKQIRDSQVWWVQKHSETNGRISEYFIKNKFKVQTRISLISLKTDHPKWNFNWYYIYLNLCATFIISILFTRIVGNNFVTFFLSRRKILKNVILMNRLDMRITVAFLREW